MAVITTYKCDKCGKEWIPGQNKEQPVGLGIRMAFGSTRPNGGNEFSAMWCRTCVIKTGMHKPFNSEEEKKLAPPQELSFEEKFTELMQSLGFVRE